MSPFKRSVAGAALFLFVGSVLPAVARTTELLRLLDMPASRVALTQTPEGVALMERVLGRQLVGHDDALVFFRALSAPEFRGVAEELEVRLASLHSDLALYARATRGAAPLVEVVPELTRGKLRMVQTRTLRGGVRLQPEEEIAAFTKLRAELEAQKVAAEAAVQAGSKPVEVPRSLAVMDLSGVVLGSGERLASEFVAFSKIRNAKFEGAVVSGYTFDHSDLRGSVFRYVEGKAASFLSADLRGIKMLESNFTSANFSGANLSKAQLIGSNFSGADLRGADLSDAFVGGRFLRSDQVDVIFEGAIFNEATRLPFDRTTAERLGMVFIQ